MTPSAFVVLNALPVTSNGKLDRAALPAPDYASAASGRPPSTPSERRVARLFEEALGLAPGVVSADSDFFALGGHSLLAARVMARVREEWLCQLGMGVLFTSPTVEQLAGRLDGLDPSSTDEGLGPLIALWGETAPPLYCIHPAGGVSWCYGALARQLDGGRIVYGVQARGLDPSETLPSTMETLAGEYVDRLLEAHPGGPYHLLGWSVGGIIAHAMAVRLQDLGLETGVLALLDAYPADCWRDQPPPDENMALRALLQIAGFHPESVTESALTREFVTGYLRRAGHPLGHLRDETLTGVVKIVENNSRLVREHRHRRYDGPLLHFRAALDHEGEPLSPDQWKPYSGEVRVYDIESLHAHMTGAAASRRVAVVLDRYLRHAEGKR